MSPHFLVIGLYFLICLIVSAILFSILAKKDFLRKNSLSGILAVGGSLVICTTPLSIIFWHQYDFVADIKCWQFLLPLLASLLILIALFIKKPFIIAGATFIASAISIFGANLSITFIPQLPLWVNQILSIFVLWGFALGYRAISGLNPLPQIEGITICLGFIMFYFFSLAPFILGSFCAGLLGILLISYLHSQTQPISAVAAPFLGFILGWIGLLSFKEYLLPSFVIFTTFYLLELLICGGRYITMLPQYRDFKSNSVSLQSLNSGLQSHTLLRIIWNTNILLLVFGLFQVNSASLFSVPSFAAIITCWQLYRLVEWQQETKTIKETNQEIVTNIKKSVDQFLNMASKNNDKTDKN